VIELRNVGFGNEGISFDYIDFSGDVRDNGMIKNHALLVPDDGTYGDEIDEVRRSMTAWLVSLLEAFEQAPAITPQVISDDEESSPYDNPLERDLGPVTP
jgi:hypothetical protein